MLAKMLEGLKDIVYPKICLACKAKLKTPAKEELVCKPCSSKIKRNLPPFCYRCGRHLEIKREVKNICVSCQKAILHFDRAFSPCVYEGVIKELIRQFKYQHKDYLGRHLSEMMIEFIKEYGLAIDFLDFVLPLPLHKTRLREREFNQSETLGNFIACEFNKPLLKDNLIRNRYTRTQTNLENEQRFLNVRDSFTLKDAKEIKAKNILLVDDVLTTGSSCSEAARTLKDSGAHIVFVLTLAN